jgi:prolyl-tRNA editing enzyme YbaK/EbsC (Cys-tRNA(Pro) deacylase)
MAIGVKTTKADADFVREKTGFAIGGIPPLGHLQPIDTYIDQDLFAWEKLWAAAGTPHAVFTLRSSDLLQLTSGKILKIT